MPRKLSRHALPDGRLSEGQYVAVLSRIQPLLQGLSRAPVPHLLVEAYMLGLRDTAAISGGTQDGSSPQKDPQ